MQKVTPFLWFNDNAEEAANFYTSVFKDAKITGMTRYGEASAAVAGRPKGSVMTIAFQLEKQEFVALNGGPMFAFWEGDVGPRAIAVQSWETASNNGASAAWICVT